MEEANEKAALIHEFYLMGSFTDVTFGIGDGDIFKAHTVILASNSKVFRKKFEEDENKTYRIGGVSADCFKTMLDFIYTGEVGNFINNAEELLKLGKEFEIEKLSLAVDAELKKWLTVDNATKVLILADNFGREQLKNYAIHFIANKMEAVVSSKNWDLLKNRFELCTELVSSAPKDSVAKQDDEFPGASHLLNSKNTVTWLVEPKWEKYNAPVRIAVGEITVWLDKHDKCTMVLQLMGFDGSMALFARMKEKGLGVANLTISLLVHAVDSFLLHKQEINFIWDRSEDNELVISRLKNECTIEYYPGQFNLTIEAHLTKHVTARHPFLRHLKVDETRFTDVVIKVGKAEFRAHKVVLASHSDYFSSLFDDGKKEYTLKMSKDVFMHLKHWMYTDTLPHPDGVSLDILRGAWLLQMKVVVEHCSFLLSQNLKTTNATDILIAAEEMKLDSLKNAARNFIAKNYEVILASEKWKAMKGRTALIKEVILKIFVR